MANIQGNQIDTEPLNELEYALLLANSEPYWQLVWRVLWETGLRISECLSRRRKHLLGNGQLEVKRLKKRVTAIDVVFISPELEADLLRYAARMKPGTKLFDRGANTAWRAMERASRRAGITRKLHPHLFRHGFGRRLAKMNLGLTALDHEALVQQMLGHSDPRYTRIYFRPAQEDVHAAWRQANRGGAVSLETAA